MMNDDIVPLTSSETILVNRNLLR